MTPVGTGSDQSGEMVTSVFLTGFNCNRRIKILLTWALLTLLPLAVTISQFCFNLIYHFHKALAVFNIVVVLDIRFGSNRSIMKDNCQVRLH